MFNFRQLSFWNCTLTEVSLAKVLRIFFKSVLVNNNLYGKFALSLELPIKFDEKFEFTLVPFYFADFNLLICELDNFTFRFLFWVILY